MISIRSLRKFLKTDTWLSQRDSGFESDQDKKLPVPLSQKEYSPNDILLDLKSPEQFKIGSIPLIEVIRNRRSRRKFTREPLSLEELSFLLWATQGVRPRKKTYAGALTTLRTVPSGGARHPFETYLAVNNVEGLQAGLYRYLPLKHKLLFLGTVESLSQKVAEACYRQKWIDNAAVVFIWTTVPYRTEWRYTFIAAKIIAQESGHLCQNLYLGSEAIGAGACAVGAYYQKEIDRLIGVDGKDEFVVYVSPVGKI